MHELPAPSPTATPTLSPATEAADPAPLFKDENITVWAVPLFASPSSPPPSSFSVPPNAIDDADIIMSPPTTLKRKLDDLSTVTDADADGPSPFKRPAPSSTPGLESEATSTSTLQPTTITIPAPAVQDLLSRYRLTPHSFPISSLTGLEADEWRRLTVASMFTMEGRVEEPEGERDSGRDGDRAGQGEGVGESGKEGERERERRGKGKKGRDGTGTETTEKMTKTRKDRGPARLNPAKSMHQLPRFEHPFASSSAPSAPSSQTSCAYLILGPRTRGRFDAARADALGLRGKLRGQVSQGETVVFFVEEEVEGDVEGDGQAQAQVQVQVQDQGGGGASENVGRGNGSGNGQGGQGKKGKGKKGKGKVKEEPAGPKKNVVLREVTVRPEDVMGESEPPVAILVIDLPTPAHIPSLFAAFAASPSPSPTTQSHLAKNPYAQFRSQDPAVNAHVVYHLLGEGVLEDGRYVEFMGGFREGTHVCFFVLASLYTSSFVTSHLAHLARSLWTRTAYSLLPRAQRRPDDVHERRAQPAQAEPARPGDVPCAQV